MDGVRGAEGLIEKIRSGDQSATAELTAISLIKSGRVDICVEVEPTVLVSGKSKTPDFVSSVAGVDPIYVEVTQPQLSKEEVAAWEAINQTTDLVKAIEQSFALEVFLHRVPSAAELAHLRGHLATFCAKGGQHREDLGGDLGFLLLNLDVPGVVTTRDHDGEQPGPRLGKVSTVGGPDGPRRHICVRLAFEDERAMRVIEREAEQLPAQSPGLIMVQTANASGAFKAWESLLHNCFQANIPDRVSAICLFYSGIQPTAEGEAWSPWTKLISNPCAALPLPAWANHQLGRFPPDW